MTNVELQQLVNDICYDCVGMLDSEMLRFQLRRLREDGKITTEQWFQACGQMVYRPEKDIRRKGWDQPIRNWRGE